MSKKYISKDSFFTISLFFRNENKLLETKLYLPIKSNFFFLNISLYLIYLLNIVYKNSNN
jgi:hypothetical protein